NMAPLRWGICATGLISQDFANALSLSPENHTIAAIGARDPNKAKEFAARFGIKTVLDSCEALGSCTDVDVVYIGSLTYMHFEHARHFLKSGKHVLCEKPLTLLPEQTAELLALAKSTSRFLMVALWSRFFPAYSRLRQAVTNGELGTVRLVQANFCLPVPEVVRLKEKKLGGGTLCDFGAYLVHLASWVYGGEKPLSVTVAGHVNETGVDRSGGIIIKYSDNRLASLTWSGDSGPATTALVLGDKGSAKLEDYFWCPTKLTLNGELIHMPTPPVRQGDKFNFFESGGLLYEANHVKECLEKGLTESPLLSHKECQLIHDILAEGHKQLGVDYHNLDA
ncbi:hypothetical protein BOX15_Mlig012888g1, partial [Macrostomum lignano]